MKKQTNAKELADQLEHQKFLIGCLRTELAEAREAVRVLARNLADFTMHQGIAGQMLNCATDEVNANPTARAALEKAGGRVVDQQARPSTAEKPTLKTGNQFLLERISELEAVLKNYGIVESEWRESKPPAPQ